MRLPTYHQTEHKIKNLWNKFITQRNKLLKEGKITVNFISENYAKGGQVFTFLENYLIHPIYNDMEETYTWTYTFELKLKGFPKWMLPYCRLIPIFSTTGGYEEFETYYFNYYFEEIEENYYVLRGIICVEFKEQDNPFYYVTLKCHIYNPKIYHEIQKRSQ